MNSNNKLGSYVSRLMVVIKDNDEDAFVRQLAWSELKRLNKDIEVFLRENSFDDEEILERQLLQEKVKNEK